MKNLNIESKADKSDDTIDVEASSIVRNFIIFCFVGFCHVSMIVVSIVGIYPTITLSNEANINREYKTKIYSWMNDHFNDKGPMYGYIVAIHALGSMIPYIPIIIPLLLVKGGKLHILYGKLSLFLFIIGGLLSMLILESIYLSNRGYLACQYKYNSFNIFISTQLISWYFWFCELICYAHVSVVYKTRINDAEYVHKSMKYFLMYLSVVSIIYCIARIPVFITILLDPKSMSCIGLYEIVLNGISCVTDLGGIIWSYYNIKYIKKSLKNEVNNDDWKRIHGRNMIIFITLYSFIFFGTVLYKFIHILYLGILYVFLIPILLVLLRYFERKRHKIRRLSNIIA